jgi:hypothetical protein
VLPRNCTARYNTETTTATEPISCETALIASQFISRKVREASLEAREILNCGFRAEIDTAGCLDEASPERSRRARHDNGPLRKAQGEEGWGESPEDFSFAERGGNADAERTASREASRCRRAPRDQEIRAQAFEAGVTRRVGGMRGSWTVTEGETKYRHLERSEAESRDPVEGRAILPRNPSTSLGMTEKIRSSAHILLFQDAP